MQDFWQKLKVHQRHIAQDYVITIMRELNEMGLLNKKGRKILENLLTKENADFSKTHLSNL